MLRAAVCLAAVAALGACHAKAEAHGGVARKPAATSPAPAGPSAQPARAQVVWMQPHMSQPEAMTLLAAAHFTLRNGKVYNQCNGLDQPGFAFTDLNGDGRAEAIIASTGAGCGGQADFNILQQDRAGSWTIIGGMVGKVVILAGRTRGWLDISVEGPGCQKIRRFDGAAYNDIKVCADVSARQDADTRAALGFPPGPPPPLTDAQTAAAWRAAGFRPFKGSWARCADAAPDDPPIVSLILADLDGDGRSEAWITEGGIACHGNVSAFVLVTAGADGNWRIVMDQEGAASALKTRHHGWPDIEIAGPGFGDVPVFAYDGKAYRYLRSVSQ